MSRKPAKAETPQAPVAVTDNVPRIVKKIPRKTEFEQVAAARHLAGVYRIIHSNVIVPRPESEWKGPDGKPIPGQPTLDFAEPGDEVYLGDEDALRLLDKDVVETLDTHPSRVGKVFVPPKVIHNMNAGPGEAPARPALPNGARI